MQSLENIMLITDLDGTLLPSSKEISAADAAAISQFRAKGGKFAIATGRTLQAAQRYLNKLKPNIPVILFNGAAIYDPVTEKWLYTEKLPADAVAVTRQVLDAFPDVSAEILRTDGTYVARMTPYEKEHLEICQVEPILAEPGRDPRGVAQGAVCDCTGANAGFNRIFCSAKLGLCRLCTVGGSLL